MSRRVGPTPIRVALTADSGDPDPVLDEAGTGAVRGQNAVARRVALTVFSIMVGGWVLLFLASGSLQRGPSPRHLGGDFVLFLSGSRVLQAGGNPYDQKVLYAAERSLLQRDGIRPPEFDRYMRVGNPPLFLWALQPLVGLPFRDSAAAWCALMYACLALAFLACLGTLHWRRRRLPLVLFLAMPQTLYAAYYGNVDGLVFVALAWGTVLARKHEYAAGALLVLAYLKPQVALPGVLLIALFLAPSRFKLIAGFAGASAAALVLTVLAAGPSCVGWWLRALTGYSQRLAVQPDIASLSGLYVYSAPDRVTAALQLASLALALAVTLAWWWRQAGSPPSAVLSSAWLWILWFLATPFAHFHDEVILALPLLAILGRDGRNLGSWPATVALFVSLLSILIFPTARAHIDFQSVTLLVVLGCAMVQLARERASVDEGTTGRRGSEPVPA